MDMDTARLSPFLVPIAGCAVGAVAIIAGALSEGQRRRIKSEERLAMIAHGVPLPQIEQFSAKPEVTKDPLRSLGNARRTGIVLTSLGLGLILFFAALALIVHTPEVLSGAAAGLIPLVIGIGFFIDYGLQRRELSRFGLEVDAERGPAVGLH
jgi:tetrahydromethanopterin S-methyltransferase subunit E